ncbi:unnamed protein product, partial [Mesorhabditis belari]|uniref:MER3 helicase-like winged helix domain-containing protein n=1 Tax=Mesorhabditis belari TaxID=2138241 RepID=A0AAF3F928_9BILA
MKMSQRQVTCGAGSPSTYLYRRLFANPNFYGIGELSEESVCHYLTTTVDQVIADLLESKCITLDELCAA